MKAQGVKGNITREYSEKTILDHEIAFDSAKNQSKNREEMPKERTPVAALNEFLMRVKLSPVYIPLGEYMGPCNKVIFTYQVTVEEHTAFGEGTSKQEAKQRAAENLLAILDRDPGVSRFIPPWSKSDDPPLNYIGELCKYCSQEKISHPVFKTTYDNCFRTVCTLRMGNRVIEAQGEGRNKRQSKHSSAEAMLTMLQKKTRSPSHKHGIGWKSTEAQPKQYSEEERNMLMDSSYLMLNPTHHPPNATQIYGNACIPEYSDPLGLLYSIIQERGFASLLYQLPSQGCMIQVAFRITSAFDLWTFIGCGYTVEEATINSAWQALQFLSMAS